MNALEQSMISSGTSTFQTDLKDLKHLCIQAISQKELGIWLPRRLQTYMEFEFTEVLKNLDMRFIELCR